MKDESVWSFDSASDIHPSDFILQFRGLESNQRPSGSEPDVTTNSNCPGVFATFDTRCRVQVRKFGEKESNLHSLLQRQVADR